MFSKTTTRRFLRCSALALAAATLPLIAQDAPAAETAPEQAVTVADPSIDVKNLDYMLDPLTQEELGREALAWRDLLKAGVGKLSEANIALNGQEADEGKEEIAGQLEQLQSDKTALAQRLEVVLTAYEEKGGDAAELRTYAKAVSGVKVDVTEPAGAMAAVRGWLRSEEGGIKWGLGLLKFAVILLLFWVVAKLVSRVVKHATDKHLEWSALLERFINKLVYRVILGLGVLVGLSTVGVNVGALLALLGGGAFIIGFALQDTLGNFAAGVMLLVYRPFDVGDVVEVGGVSGKVDNVSLVSTTIKTFDNKVVLVPNKNVWGQVITNATASGERRVDMVFGIGYDDDIDKAQKILGEIVGAHALVLETPAPVIRMNELADSSVNFVCRPWAKTSDYWDVYWDVTRKVKDEFDAAGISFPYPQQDVHMHQAD